MRLTCEGRKANILVLLAPGADTAAEAEVDLEYTLGPTVLEGRVLVA